MDDSLTHTKKRSEELLDERTIPNGNSLSDQFEKDDEIKCTLRAESLLAMGDFSSALDAANQALNISPSFPRACFAAGMALYMLKRSKDALIALEPILSASTPLPDALWFRANLFRHVYGDSFPGTISAYNLALEADPENQYARTERAAILRTGCYYEEACQDYEAVLSSKGEEQLLAEAAFGLGCARLVMNDPAAARRAFRQLLDISPDYPDAQEMYDLLAVENSDME